MYKLNRTITLQQQNLLKNVEQQLLKNILEISNDNYHSKQWKRIFPMFANLKNTYLFINNNQTSAIWIRDICCPHFINIKSLYLNNDLIESIEGLARITAPRLEELSLMNNNITKIKSIYKVNFPSLQFINICNNPIIDPSPLAGLVSKKMKFYHIQRWVNHRCIGENVAWTAKMQYFQEITLKSNRRRNKGKICEQINKKSQKICFS